MSQYITIPSGAADYYPTDGMGGQTSTAASSFFQGARANYRVLIEGFQPSATGAGTVSIGGHASTADIVITTPASPANNYLPFGPAGIVVSGVGLKLTASAANLGGTLFYDIAKAT